MGLDLIWAIPRNCNHQVNKTQNHDTLKDVYMKRMITISAAVALSSVLVFAAGTRKEIDEEATMAAKGKAGETVGCHHAKVNVTGEGTHAAKAGAKGCHHANAKHAAAKGCPHAGKAGARGCSHAKKADAKGCPHAENTETKGGHHAHHATAEVPRSALNDDGRCPVMGGEIDSTVYSDYNGSRVYFCCPGCIYTFEKNPQKYDASAKQSKGEITDSTSLHRYEVFGMDCPGCHGGVEKLVKAVLGVEDARANYLKKEIVVTAAAGQSIDKQAVFEAIRKANFTPGKVLTKGE